MSFTKDKDSDNYTSDKNAWEIIKKYIPTDKIIWSPFFSDGKQKKYFKELGFDIIHKDEDFFSYTPEYDLIVDNIPFSKNKDMVKDWDKELRYSRKAIGGATIENLDFEVGTIS